MVMGRRGREGRVQIFDSEGRLWLWPEAWMRGGPGSWETHEEAGEEPERRQDRNYGWSENGTGKYERGGGVHQPYGWAACCVAGNLHAGSRLVP